MNSNAKQIKKGPLGKPDLSVLEPKTALSFIEKGHDEGAGTPSTETPDQPLRSGHATTYAATSRVVKVPVSLRLPQTMTDMVMELAAKETLGTRVRVTPHDIYVRAISAYLKNETPSNT